MLKMLILRQLSTYNFATVPLTLARFVFAIIHLGMSIEETLYRFRLATQLGSETPLTGNTAEGSISLGGVSLSESRHHCRGCLSLSLGIVCLPIIRFKEIECLINFYFLANLDAHTH